MVLLWERTRQLTNTLTLARRLTGGAALGTDPPVNQHAIESQLAKKHLDNVQMAF